MEPAPRVVGPLIRFRDVLGRVVYGDDVCEEANDDDRCGEGPATEDSTNGFQRRGATRYWRRTSSRVVAEAVSGGAELFI